MDTLAGCRARSRRSSWAWVGMSTCSMGPPRVRSIGPGSHAWPVDRACSMVVLGRPWTKGDRSVVLGPNVLREAPAEHDVVGLLGGARAPIGGHRGIVVAVGQHPHP